MYTFELIGLRLCLDFCNTIDNRTSPPTDEHLPDYGELLRWAVAAGALRSPDAARLAAEARHHPREAERVVEAAHEVRQAFFRVVTRRRPTDEDLAQISRFVADALAHTALSRSGDSYRLELAAPASLESVLWPVARSMADVLTSGDLARVRMCEMHHLGECTWVFLDDTRNGTRRWCDMRVCGNRAKARRHYQRKRTR
jgi:predicted RNA-binding Zn ribbon-like protein